MNQLREQFNNGDDEQEEEQ